MMQDFMNLHGLTEDQMATLIKAGLTDETVKFLTTEDLIEIGVPKLKARLIINRISPVLTAVQGHAPIQAQIPPVQAQAQVPPVQGQDDEELEEPPQCRQPSMFELWGPPKYLLSQPVSRPKNGWPWEQALRVGNLMLYFDLVREAREVEKNRTTELDQWYHDNPDAIDRIANDGLTYDHEQWLKSDKERREKKAQELERQKELHTFRKERRA